MPEDSAAGVDADHGYMVRLDRDVLEVSGPESGSFLQGQLSQDVLGLVVGQTAWSWVLAPTGKVDALVRIFRCAEDGWFLDTDGGWGEALLARLSRFKLRTKADLAQVPLRVLGVRAEGAFSGGLSPLAVCDGWPGERGKDLIVSPADYDSASAVSASSYESERIRLGIPRMGAELDEKTIPGETGLIEFTVSFTKGCYTGQELVARIDSRGGNVPRRLVRLAMDAPVEAGVDLRLGEQEAGVVTSVAAGRRGFIGLGYLKRAFESPISLTAGPGGPVVEVEPITR